MTTTKGDQMDLKLKHTERVEDLLAAGRTAEARELHLAHVDAELERSKSEPINLSDLMAGNEAFHLADLKKRGA